MSTIKKFNQFNIYYEIEEEEYNIEKLKDKVVKL